MDLKKLYMRERKRIQNYQSRLRGQGLNSGRLLGDIPKVITKQDIDTLKGITPGQIRGIAETRQSELKKEYRRQRRRIQNYQSRLRSEGFEINMNLPSIPDVVTENDIEVMKSITPEEIQEYAYRPEYWLENESVKSYREKKQKGDIPDYTPIFKENTMAMLNHYPKTAKIAIQPIIDRLVEEFGEARVYQKLALDRHEGNLITGEVAYQQEMLHAYGIHIADLFNRPGLAEGIDDIIFESEARAMRG